MKQQRKLLADIAICARFVGNLGELKLPENTFRHFACLGYFRPDMEYRHLQMVLEKLGDYNFEFKGRKVICTINDGTYETSAEDGPWELGMGNEVGLCAAVKHIEFLERVDHEQA